MPNKTAIPNKTTIEDKNNKKKSLGASSYKNSKQKKKIQSKKLAEVKKVVTKDRQIKVKIKHLQKELERLNKLTGELSNVKTAEEKLAIENKIVKLNVVNNKFIKIPSQDL
jgi:DNA primase catalytic subunit